MAAPRLYDNQKRAELFRLYQGGMSPTEIAEAVKKGTSGCAPFEIPRRTVSEIVRQMAKEADQHLPRSIEEAESLVAIARFPARVRRILDALADQLERKKDLTISDLEKLERAAKISLTVTKELEKRRQRPLRKTPSAPGQPTEAPAGKDDERNAALEQLIGLDEEDEGSGVQLSDARTCHESTETAPESANPSAADAPPTPLRPTRAEIALKARAALDAVPS